MIEVMVSLVVGLILMAGATSMYGSMMRGNATAVKNARLSQELRAVMEVITRDLRRAGFWGGTAAAVANDLADLANNPFGIRSVSPANDCILYSLDKDSSSAREAGERLGFRINARQVEWRDANQAGGAAWACDQNAGWSPISDASVVTVTNLSFTLVEACVNVTQGRQSCAAPGLTPQPGDLEVTAQVVMVNLSGRLTNDPAVTLALAENVQVRNEKVAIR